MGTHESSSVGSGQQSQSAPTTPRRRHEVASDETNNFILTVPYLRAFHLEGKPVSLIFALLSHGTCCCHCVLWQGICTTVAHAPLRMVAAAPR